MWTIDTFEFPLTKKSSVLQLPEWNELRPMNLTPKVTVIYAFSSTGQSIEPVFIFPNSFHRNEIDYFNELGHLTPEIFLSYCQTYLCKQSTYPFVLIFCSRLPVLSFDLCSKLKQLQIFPFGYPFIRTLPFRYLFERHVRNNRSTNLMSELWKKKLLDETRTHVLKNSDCTIERIQFYFQQIWKQICDENQPFDDKCQQAFQQANIQLKTMRKTIKLLSKRNNKKLQEVNLIHQLEQLLTHVAQLKDQISSVNLSSQILKMNNHSDEMIESSSTDSETLLTQVSEKRSINENDQPTSHANKRLRQTTWNPPSKEFVRHLQNQSSSLLQFTLALVNTIVFSSDCQLTDEHSNWLHTTMNSFGHNYNREKINILIETACKIAKLNLVR